MDDTLIPKELFQELKKSQQGPMKFGSIMLYGEAVQNEEDHGTYRVYHLKNNSGLGDITVYPVFPGVELIYNDLHLRYCDPPTTGARQIIEINHCQLGRYECNFRKQDYCYMEPGDFSISSPRDEKCFHCFPLNHYHGISITIDMSQIDSQTMKLMEFLSIDLKHIASLIKNRNYFILRASDMIEHIFSELYTVRDHIKFGYIKVKVLELFLMLTDLQPMEKEIDRPYFSKSQIDAVKQIHDFILNHIDEHYTLEQLAERVDISPTVMKKCFKCVYGKSVYAYLKKCRLEIAAQLLTDGEMSIGEIAVSIGYDNPAKFASAFKQEYGLSPSNYKKLNG